ncbi:Cytosine-specific methyltransferase [Candidatus Desulfarcum epimagneticum]|uniref:Cytosine-specific methyltransferase n=1 Tax=uncultured Desulfobacteraceae bacterium TaxID=218296 RepID=A0A484HG85_9BACT|nr:Cytosine-specific methyltransferase [uncultured Desulfobacteraceae bacterium]
MTQRSDLQVVSLFSGCGGLDHGFKSAGYSVRFANDFDKFSCETLRLNGQENVLHAPIEDVSASEIGKIIGTQPGACDVLIGGPPCQPFSKSAYWRTGDTLRLKDPRANTLEQYFRFVEDLQPHVFLLENVHGLNYNGKEEGFRFIMERIKEINHKAGLRYIPSWEVLNVADYGAPQLRVRFFLVASRRGAPFRFPHPTHVASQEVQLPLLGEMAMAPYVTAWEAIGGIAPSSKEKLRVGGKWADLLPSIPEGQNYLWHTDRRGGLPLFGWRARYWSFLLKLSKRLPSWTIQAQPGSAIGPFHWNNRKLSWQEMAAIQTFPNSFIIDAPRTEIQRQIGNAAPSLMAEVLAREIAQQMFGGKFKNNPTLAVTRCGGVPEPEPVDPVPEKYLHLTGDHAAHPGVGKGRSYMRKKNPDNAMRPDGNFAALHSHPNP